LPHLTIWLSNSCVSSPLIEANSDLRTQDLLFSLWYYLIDGIHKTLLWHLTVQSFCRILSASITVGHCNSSSLFKF
jgi:hypothetical protein